MWTQSLSQALGFFPEATSRAIQRRQVNEALFILDHCEDRVGVHEACVARLDGIFMEGEGREAFANFPEYERLWDEVSARGFEPDIINGLAGFGEFKDATFLMARPSREHLLIRDLSISSALYDKLRSVGIDSVKDLLVVAEDLHTLNSIKESELEEIERALASRRIEIQLPRKSDILSSRLDFHLPIDSLPNSYKVPRCQ